MMYCEVNVGERIRYFRNLRGWSQETLALQAEINPAFLGHLERGLKSPTIKTLEKIVRALDISLAELFADPQPVDNAKDASSHTNRGFGCATKSATSRSKASSVSMSSYGMFWRWGSNLFHIHSIANEVDRSCPPRSFFCI